MMQSEVAVLGDVYDFLVATAASYPRSIVPFRKTEKRSSGMTGINLLLPSYSGNIAPHTVPRSCAARDGIRQYFPSSRVIIDT